MWLSFDRFNILIDPGPGALIRMFERGLDPRDVDIFILSHRHLDHTADINAVLESATESTKKKKDILICPKDALKDCDSVVLPYLQKGLKSIEFIHEGKTIKYKNISINGLIKHIHKGADTYGLEIKNDSKSFVYVPCGRFFEGMLDGYPKGADLMVFNTTFTRPVPNVDHLSASDVRKMLLKLKPKKAIITHFSVQMLKASPQKVAENLSKETNVEVIASKDGLKVEF
ncbi:MAG: MBL fold metallo-hydrolase [Aquificae bacterium]|nr:MBL fold metallo-hydrolase [Aquificota bacterium]